MTTHTPATRKAVPRRPESLYAAAERLMVHLEWDLTTGGLAPGHSRVLLGHDEGLVNTNDAATIAQAEAIAMAFPWLDITIQAGYGA